MAQKRNFKKLSNVEHVRLRTGMWLGQNSELTYDQHFFKKSKNKFEVVHVEVTDVPAKMKCLDEVVMNCVDEYNKNLGDSSIKKKDKLNEISVAISDNRKRILIKDNGRGIPEKNADGVYVHLMYGENFDDKVKRDRVAGQNGVGVSLVRIVSKYFKVTTNNNKKSFTKIFTPTEKFLDTLKQIRISPEDREGVIGYFEEHGIIDGAPMLTDAQSAKLKKVMSATLMVAKKKSCKPSEHGTSVIFELNSKYFNSLDMSYNEKLVRQYLQDIAMTNPGLKVIYNYKKTKEVFLFVKGMEDVFKQSDVDFYKMSYSNKKSYITLDSYFVAGQNKSLTWVNSNFASLGGSPVEYLENRICDEVRKKPSITALERKLKTTSTRNDVRNCFHIYNDFKILNPRFKSQDKSYIINDLNEEIREAVDIFLDRIIKKLDLITNVKQQMEKRSAMRALDDAQKNLRKANKNNIPKLVSPSSRAGTEGRILFVAEGDSAIAGIRPVRNPRLHGLFPLRGKPLNVKGMSLARAMKNQEIHNVVAILGLPINSKVKSISELNYTGVSIMTDADFDGYAIRSLMLSFFYEYWPELFTMGFIHISASPLYEVEVENIQKHKKLFYCIDDDEYDKLMRKVKASGSVVTRKKRNKGLGETSKDAMKYAVDHCMSKIVVTNTKIANSTQQLWFHKDFAPQRRKAISEYSKLFFDD